MGMFDSIFGVPVKCPSCGRDMSKLEFQTKGLSNSLCRYDFGMTIIGDNEADGNISALGICYCQKFVDVTLAIIDNRIAEVKAVKIEDWGKK